MTNREFYIQRISSESPTFSRVIRALPADKLDWRPDPKARSARELVGHLIGHEQDLIELVDTGTINHRNQVPFTDLDQAVTLFEQAHQELERKAAALDDHVWDDTPARFMAGGHLVMEAPYRELAWMLLFDSVHHRGQLSTFIRPMGGKVPSIYGPSADDAGPGH